MSLKTTEEWWEEVSNDEDKMINWLKNQYHGEATAQKRIKDLVDEYNLSEGGIEAFTIGTIASEEGKHAQWVKGLLESRGIEAEILEKESRYWNETLPKTEEENTFTYICAVAHLAETMRLERITLLSEDKRFEDIAAVFSEILNDEIYHAKAFELMSTKEDIEKAREFHNNGRNALGLVS